MDDAAKMLAYWHRELRTAWDQRSYRPGKRAWARKCIQQIRLYRRQRDGR